jgi:hypothetical protein
MEIYLDDFSENVLVELTNWVMLRIIDKMWAISTSKIWILTFSVPGWQLPIPIPGLTVNFRKNENEPAFSALVDNGVRPDCRERRVDFDYIRVGMGKNLNWTKEK